MSSQPQSKGFSSTQVATIAGGHLFHDFYTSFVAPLLPLLIDKLGLSLTAAGALTTLLRLPSILNPLLGYVADKTGALYFIILTPGLTGTALSLLGTAPTPLLLGLLLTTAGLSSAMFHSVSPALTGKISGSKVGLGMSFFMAGGGLGRAAGPLVIIWAVEQWGLNGTYRLMLIGWLVSLILLWQFRGQLLTSPSVQMPSLRKAFPVFRSFFLPLALILLLRSFFLAAVNTYLPTFMTRSGAPLWMAGASLTTLEIAGVAGALAVGPISDSWGRKTTLASAMLISGLTLFGFLQLSGWAVIPLLIVLGFFSKSTGVVFLALVQDHFQRHRATGNGLFMLLSFLSNALMLVVIGYLGDTIGLRPAYLIACAFAVLTAPALVFLPESNHARR
jgi:FSR family fosmidomycin resistance protein-like MFS transporter